MTRQQRVLKTLCAAILFKKVWRYDKDGNHFGEPLETKDGWIPGWFLCDPTIGGSEGLRRVRELRELYEIEMKPSRYGDTYEYRINATYSVAFEIYQNILHPRKNAPESTNSKKAEVYPQKSKNANTGDVSRQERLF